jgi:hypothetical protein
VSLLLLLWSLPVAAQVVNFKPLARGEYEEEEEKLFILRGIRVGGDYAIRSARDKHESLSEEEETTRFKQDFRLDLRTVFHRDVEMQLVLETQPSSMDSRQFREAADEDRNRITESGSLSLNAREAYLRYKFNPGSALILGKQEISLGDRRGKTFHGIAPGFTYDCRVGTWCMPFGGLKIGEEASDWIFHWALEYTAWEEERNGLSDTFKVEIFRIIYTENNVPLGTNRGPALFNRSDPDDPLALDASQAVDSLGNPIYYDAEKQDYFGFRLKWDSGVFFFNFDVVSNQGDRKLHRYREGTSIQPLDFEGSQDLSFGQPVSGIAWESEVGFRTPQLRYGLRLMSASGDPPVTPDTTTGLTSGLGGFYEITPGSYQGTRLYFNGNDATVELSGGLGHSINNTRLYGFFLDFSDPQGRGLEYSLGIYRLERQHPVFDALGFKQTDIGTEVDNMFGFYIHKAIKLQLEGNLMFTGKAFAPNDHTLPSGVSEDFFLQGIARLVYSF